MKSLFKVKGYAESRLFNSKDYLYKNLFFVHQDGSEFKIKSVFLEKYQEFYIFYTEHHGIVIYPDDEIVLIQEFDS